MPKRTKKRQHPKQLLDQKEKHVTRSSTAALIQADQAAKRLKLPTGMLVLTEGHNTCVDLINTQRVFHFMEVKKTEELNRRVWVEWPFKESDAARKLPRYPTWGAILVLLKREDSERRFGTKEELVWCTGNEFIRFSDLLVCLKVHDFLLRKLCKDVMRIVVEYAAGHSYTVGDTPTPPSD